MSVQANPKITPQQVDIPTASPVYAGPGLITQGLETIIQGAGVPQDSRQVRSLKTPVDARPATPQDSDYFDAIVTGRSFVLENPVLIQYLETPTIRNTARVTYGLNQHGQRVEGLSLTLDDHQTVWIPREALTKQTGFQSAADQSVTPVLESGSDGSLKQTPESRLNAAWAPRAGVAYLPDVIDPDADAVVALVADLHSQGRLQTGITEAAVFSVVQAEIARRYQYQSDGDQDQWQSAHDTLQRSRGDCEDWSIALASVLTRALHVTGHSADAVKLHLVVDGAQGHMVVGYAGYIWDSQQPNQLSLQTARPIATVNQSNIWVMDTDALNSIIQSGPATENSVQIYQKISFEDRSDRNGLPLSFNELAYNTTNDLYRLVHGKDSEFRAVANALVD